jgi:ribosomal-protein-serine acetyltransferase
MFRAHIRQDVYLQLLEERHAPQIFSLVDQERDFLRQWLPWVDATLTEDDSLSFIRSTLEQFVAQKALTAGIWSGYRCCGIVGTHRLDPLNRKVEIGYWLGREFQGQGIMTSACRALVTHLLGELDLNRVEIQCAKDNQKSAAVAERLGFVEEGSAREAQLLHGRFHDLRGFAMLKKDWNPGLPGVSS